MDNVSSNINSNYEQGLSLKDIFLIIWRWKWVIVIITFLGLLVSFSIGYIVGVNNSRVTTIVEFQWDGISKGEYPDGQRFDYGSAIDGSIINQVLEDVGSDLTITDIQQNLTVTPIVPDNVIEAAEKAFLQNISFTYYPTSFKLSLDYRGLGITKESGLNIVNLIIDTFRDSFERKYIDRTVILDYSNEDLTSYDYIESHEILSSQTQLIKNAISNVMPEGNDFISSQLGISFNDILVRVNLLESIELNNMESRINNYLLSKDADLLITIYEYRVEQLEYNLAEKEDIETELQLLITNYTGGTSTIIIPGMASEDQVMVEPYLNSLYENLVSTQADIASYEQDIAFYNLRIDRLNGDDPTFSVTQAKQAEEIIKVEESITSSASIISNIVEDTNILLTEYNLYVTRGLVKSVIPPQYTGGTNLVLFAIVGIVLGGIIGVGSAFVMDYRVKNKNSKEVTS